MRAFLTPLWPDLDAGSLWPGVSFESFSELNGGTRILWDSFSSNIRFSMEVYGGAILWDSFFLIMQF